MTGAYDVFISYARTDAARARVIREKLAALGLNVFFDTEGIDTGEEFPVIIDRAVKGAKCVLGLWSRGAFTGRWVRIESRIGLDQKKLVAALVDSMRPEELPAEFYNVNVENLASFRGDDAHEGWTRVVRAIGKRVGRGDLARYGGQAASAPARPAQSVTAAVKQLNPLYMAGGALALLVAIALFQLSNQGGGDPSDRFSGNRVFSPSEAAASGVAADLTGAWSGAYREGGRETPFDIEFRSEIAGLDGAGVRRFAGQVGEPNTFGVGTGAQYLYASVTGEAHADGAISFVKTYNGAGGVGHSVRYDGRIDNGGRTITGTWTTGTLSGDFRMDRR